MDDLHGSVAVATGGAGGIGRALGAALAAAGCRVVLGVQVFVPRGLSGATSG